MPKTFQTFPCPMRSHGVPTVFPRPGVPVFPFLRRSHGVPKVGNTAFPRQHGNAWAREHGNHMFTRVHTRVPFGNTVGTPLPCLPPQKTFLFCRRSFKNDILSKMSFFNSCFYHFNVVKNDIFSIFVVYN